MIKFPLVVVMSYAADGQTLQSIAERYIWPPPPDVSCHRLALLRFGPTGRDRQ
jgi:hypothetical protein